MAKKKDEETALAKTEAPGALAPMPDFIPRGSEGTEHMTRDDVQIPRIAIAQGLSPQVNPDDDLYIDGLKQGDMFNTLTGQILGRGPLDFHIVRADKPRYIEFNDRDEGGGVKDMNVPPGDPRTLFRTDEDGQSLPPLATKFYDYFVVPVPLPEEAGSGFNLVLALSMKGSQIKVAKQFNMLIKSRGAAVYGGRYSVTTVSEKNSKGSFYNFKVEVCRDQPWAESAEQLAFLKTLFESMKDKVLKVDREPGGDEADGSDGDDDKKVPF